MSTNGQLLARALRGQTLLESEIMQLERALGEYDRAKVFADNLQNGSAEINIRRIESFSGYFEELPLYPYRAERIDPQSTNHNTETFVAFDSPEPSNLMFRIDTANSRIYPLKQARAMLIFGTVQWAANATGRRAVHMNWFSAAGVQLYGMTLHSVPPEGTAPDTIPFVQIFDLAEDDPGAYMKFSVWQTSGGALTFENFRAGVFVVE